MTADPLGDAFRILDGVLPLQRSDFDLLLSQAGPASRISLVTETLYGHTWCLFSYPLYRADCIPFDPREDSLRDAAMEQFIVLVFDEQRNVIADLAAYGMSLGELRKEPVRRHLEEESDWLYWQTEIVLAEGSDCSRDTEILLFTNAYTAKDMRRTGIFRHMLEMVSDVLQSRRSDFTLISCISLDPDIPCYGKDRTDVPYIYSMADEPARLRNAAIMERLGWQSLCLETEEPVEDGAILRFAVRKTTYITI